jgi:hypothetical protein
VENIARIQFIHVPNKDTNDKEVKLDYMHASAATVPNMRELHCFIPTGTNKIRIQCVLVAPSTQWSA